jgi:hypothetical protein
MIMKKNQNKKKSWDENKIFNTIISSTKFNSASLMRIENLFLFIVLILFCTLCYLKHILIIEEWLPQMYLKNI